MHNSWIRHASQKIDFHRKLRLYSSFHPIHADVSFTPLYFLIVIQIYNIWYIFGKLQNIQIFIAISSY